MTNFITHIYISLSKNHPQILKYSDYLQFLPTYFNLKIISLNHTPSPLPPHFSSTALYFYPHLLLNPNHHNPLQTHPPILLNFHVFQPKVPHHPHTSTHLHSTYHHVPSFSPLSLPYPFY